MGRKNQVNKTSAANQGGGDPCKYLNCGARGWVFIVGGRSQSGSSHVANTGFVAEFFLTC